MNKNDIKTKVFITLKELTGERYIPISVSARHVHLSQDHIEKLFGIKQLTIRNQLTQPGQFASEEKLKLTGIKGEIDNVRVLGPERTQTQIEISLTDAIKLGINAPIRMSGDLKGTPGIKLTGPRGSVDIQAGVIVAKRHLHISPGQAEAFGVKDGSLIDVEVEGERPTIFKDVAVRMDDRQTLEMHIDTDEANAAYITSETVGKITACAGEKLNKFLSSVISAETLTKESEPLGLVTETDVINAFKAEIRHLTVKKGAIITPLAKDAAKEKGILISFEP